ncbi:hypothetical protein VitviT2T_007318 [Vitis vinifera]|nr:clathrin interactor EPSIN 2 isoform X2 [Vitis vinifera]WJZ87977.1 hypothetical protein VitviT2T_007318 [Vitis vinifera]|eukprot:XP_002267552.2 PREDICTED: clathrin interactor EPSIN 2 isoform X2 [Vitis vinifera]
MYRPSSYSSSGGYGDRYDDDRYEGRYGRDEDRNGYGREREWGSRDDDRYGRNGDSYGPEGDRYGRDSDERYGRDGYKDDDYRGRSRRNEDYQYGSRSRSADRDRDRAFDEESNHSSRGGARTNEHPQYGRQLERKFSEQNLDAPPSYEEAVADAHSPVHDERDGATPAAPAPKTSSPPVSTSPSQATTAVGPSTSPPANKEVDAFDEFDPRGPVSAVPATSISPEMDLLGSLSESFSSNSLALVPSGPATTTSEAAVLGNAGSAPASAAMPSGSAVMSQSFEDPFGDSPFRALPSAESVPAQPQDSASTTSFQTMNQTSGPPFPVNPRSGHGFQL